MSRNRSDPLAPLLGRGSLEIPRAGRLWLVWSGSGLVQVAWSEQELAGEGIGGGLKALPRRLPVPESFRVPLEAYFSGRPVDPAEVPVDLRGTPFQVKVWRALREIPRGRVLAYADIAARIGSPRAARAVGTACRDNRLPIVVPCHRVVASSGALGGYSGGLERKKWLLGLEGVYIA